MCLFLKYNYVHALVEVVLLSGAGAVTCVWGWGCHICLGLGVPHVSGAGAATSGAGGVTCVWGWGNYMCLGLGVPHVFGAATWPCVLTLALTTVSAEVSTHDRVL